MGGSRKGDGRLGEEKRGRKKLRESDVLQEQRSNMRVYARTPPADTLKCQPQIFQTFMAPEVPLRKKTSLWWVGATLAWLRRNYQSLCQARVVPMPESGWQTSTCAYQVLVLCGNIFKQVLSFYWVAASPVFSVSKAWRSGVQMSLNHKTLSFPEIKGEYKAGKWRRR